MGLMSALTGNASEISVDSIQEEVGPLLAPGESITKAYKMIRDYFVFTTSRLILIDKQGVTGKKTEFHIIPYRSITSYKIETAGYGIDDSELKIYVHGEDDPITKEFNKSIDIADLQIALATQMFKE